MKGEDVTFKKDGADPITARPRIDLSFIGAMWELFGIGVSKKEPKVHYDKPKKQAARPARKRNMLLVSKRTRRKHRRAHAA